MTSYEIEPILNLKNIIAELREYTQTVNEFADSLEQLEKKYGEQQESEDKV